MKTLFIITLILSVFAPIAVGQNPDAPGYIEPCLMFGVGEGTIRSDILRHGFDASVSPLDLGFQVKALTPINNRTSFVIKCEYFWSRTQWRGGYEKESLRRFRVTVGFRFYAEKK